MRCVKMELYKFLELIFLKDELILYLNYCVCGIWFFLVGFRNLNYGVEFWGFEDFKDWCFL